MNQNAKGRRARVDFKLRRPVKVKLLLLMLPNKNSEAIWLAGQAAASLAAIAVFGWAPIRRSIRTPFLKISIVGMLWI